MSNTTLEWIDLASLGSEVRQPVLNQVERLIQNHPDANIDHDPYWLSAKCGNDKSSKLFVCITPDNTVAGYAPFFIHPSALSFQLFGISVYDYRIRRYCITATPLLAEEYQSLSSALLEKLLITLREIIGDRDSLFGLGVEKSSNFSQFILENSELRKYYQVLPYGQSYFRRLISLPKDFEAYLKGLGNSTRYEMRRALRLLEKDTEITTSYRIFTQPEEVVELLQLLQQVSLKTYQHQLLNLGINDNAENRHTFELAARKGWLRSLILFSNNEPIAFQHGFLYKKCFYLTHIGYDPAWAKWSVGTITHAYLIQNLIEVGAEKFDFLYGDNGSKARLSNDQREEQNFYIVPRKFPLSFIASMLQAFNFVMNTLGRAIEKFGIKTLIRRFLRRRATSSSEKK